MRRILVVLSLVAMLAVAAVPALAQDFEAEDFEGGFLGDGFFVVGNDDFSDDGFVVGPFAQEFEQEDVESGDVEPVVDISNTGDNVNLSPAVLQSANSGNVQNAQGVVQYQSEADDIEFEGSSITIAPELEQESNQAIEQAASAR
ncbi:MAG: hypothetical protein M3246_06405 [Actinomycetota bacterium]|nr:hypothetical protein [Actinomycetota bacterium]